MTTDDDNADGCISDNYYILSKAVYYEGEQGDNGEIWAVGKGVVSFLFPGDKQDERSHAAKYQTNDDDRGQSLRSEPKAEGGDELDVASAYAAFCEDCDNQKENTASKRCQRA